MRWIINLRGRPSSQSLIQAHRGLAVKFEKACTSQELPSSPPFRTIWEAVFLLLLRSPSLFSHCIPTPPAVLTALCLYVFLSPFRKHLLTHWMDGDSVGSYGYKGADEESFSMFREKDSDAKTRLIKGQQWFSPVHMQGLCLSPHESPRNWHLQPWGFLRTLLFCNSTAAGVSLSPLAVLSCKAFPGSHLYLSSWLVCFLKALTPLVFPVSLLRAPSLVKLKTSAMSLSALKCLYLVWDQVPKFIPWCP